MLCVVTHATFQWGADKWTHNVVTIQISGYPDIRSSRFPDIRISGYPDTRISGYPNTRLSGYPDIRIPGYPAIRLSGYPGNSIFVYVYAGPSIPTRRGHMCIAISVKCEFLFCDTHAVCRSNRLSCCCSTD